jgi:hypothetical protein
MPLVERGRMQLPIGISRLADPSQARHRSKPWKGAASGTRASRPRLSASSAKASATVSTRETVSVETVRSGCRSG